MSAPQPTPLPTEKQVVVEFPAGTSGNQMAAWMWVRDSGHNPNDWKVYRSGTQLGNWDQVTLGETVTLKPVDRS
jgi:hypothetical protein